MELIFSDYLDQLIDPFINPRKRVFVGYLAASLLIALGFYAITTRASLPECFSTLFSRRIWWSRSARADVKILLINQALMLGIMPRLISRLAVATLIFESLHVWFDGRTLLFQGAPDWAIAGFFTFLLFLVDDAVKYLVHRVLHRWPVLWCFHKVHHTAETLTPLTVYRTHPVEALIFALRSIVVQGTMVAGFLYFFGDRAELVTVLGANIFLALFNATGSNLRHSHVWLSYGRWVERVLISPAQHQIHHSAAPAHHDRNFGAVLAVWDWMGGSLCTAGKYQSLRYGVGGPADAPHDLKSLYLTSFVDAARRIRRSTSKGQKKMPMFFPSKTKRRTGAGGLIVILGLTLSPLGPAKAGEVLNIYSHRQPFLIQPFIDAYTAETDTKVNVVFASKGLAQRLEAEGARSPADVILTVDIARLHVYADKNLLAPVHSEVLKRDIPAHLRAPDDTWFAFSKRARVIAVSRETRDTWEIARYEDLADPKWKGRICSRPGSHVYNRALVASLINAVGVEKTEAWARGIVDNLARRPQGNDRAQVKAIHQGVCDIAIINNYYFGKLKHSDKPDQREWAEAVKLIFPNQGDRGTHMNISGGGVAKHSRNKAEAVRFLEFLTSTAAQNLYGAINFEYPVNPEVPVSAELQSWGSFQEDRVPIARISELAPEAQKVIDRARW